MRNAVLDALTDEDLQVLGPAVAQVPMVSGAAGLAAGIAAHWGLEGAADELPGAPATGGARGAVGDQHRRRPPGPGAEVRELRPGGHVRASFRGDLVIPLETAALRLARDHDVFFLANHGIVTCGASLDQAVDLAEEAEAAALTQLQLEGQPVRVLGEGDLRLHGG